MTQPLFVVPPQSVNIVELNPTLHHITVGGFKATTEYIPYIVATSKKLQNTHILFMTRAQAQYYAKPVSCCIRKGKPYCRNTSGLHTKYSKLLLSYTKSDQEIESAVFKYAQQREYI